jgi:dihydroorotase
MTAGGELYGLPAPLIAVGETANLCLIDLEARFQVGEDGYASRSANCCFHGRTLHGRVVTTVAGGQIAYRRPMLVARTPTPAAGRAGGGPDT